MTNFTTLKTITLKTIGLEIPQGGGNFVNKTVALVTGKATSYGIKITTYGESTRLDGSFMVANAITGEVFEGSSIYLPKDYAESVANALNKSEGGEVIIGNNETPLEIICSPSLKSSRGYAFIIRDASTPKVIQARQEMAAALTGALAQLPAPEKAKSKAA